MAHVEKYTRGACGHLFKHYERAKDKDGNYIKFSNENINLDRTHLNYNLAPVHRRPDGKVMTQSEFVRERCNSVRCLKRKDVNVMCSWVVTLPKDNYPIPGWDRDFFESAYEFLSERYGEENVISAYVHMDEVTPHMHFIFVPVVIDKKRGDKKVSAKEVLTRQDLQTFHKDLQEHITFKGMLPASVINQATKDGNKTVTELKRQSELEKQAEYARQTQNAILKAKEVQDSINVLVDKENVLKGQIRALEGQLDNIYTELSFIPSKSDCDLVLQGMDIIARYAATLDPDLQGWYQAVENTCIPCTNPYLTMLQPLDTEENYMIVENGATYRNDEMLYIPVLLLDKDKQNYTVKGYYDVERGQGYLFNMKYASEFWEKRNEMFQKSRRCPTNFGSLQHFVDVLMGATERVRQGLEHMSTRRKRGGKVR